MKKIITTVLMSAMLFVCCTYAAAEGFETWYVNANSGLNCRTEPSASSDILTVYPLGSKLEIIGVDDTGKWWQTWDGAVQGWCFGRYFSSTPRTDKISENVSENSSGTVGKYLGNFRVTGYTSSPAENNGYSVNCYGESLDSLVGQIVATDPSVIPLKSKIYIEGIGYREVRDTGVRGRTIDVLTSSDGESNAITGNYNVYLVE